MLTDRIELRVSISITGQAIHYDTQLAKVEELTKNDGWLLGMCQPSILKDAAEMRTTYGKARRQ
jgi:hypothetical protein